MPSTTSVFPEGLDAIRTDVSGSEASLDEHSRLHNLSADAINKLQQRVRNGLFIDAMDDGALGDGTTADHAAIAQSLARATASGLPLHLRGGRTFALGGAVAMPSDSRVVFEPGAKVKMLAAVGTTGGSAFTGTSVSRIRIEDPDYDGSLVPAPAPPGGATFPTYAEGQGHALAFVDCTDVTVVRPRIAYPMRGAILFLRCTNPTVLGPWEAHHLANGQVPDTYRTSDGTGTNNNMGQVAGVYAEGCARVRIGPGYVRDSDFRRAVSVSLRMQAGDANPATAIPWLHDAWVDGVEGENLGLQTYDVAGAGELNQGGGGMNFVQVNPDDPNLRPARLMLSNCRSIHGGDGGLYIGWGVEANIVNWQTLGTVTGFGMEIQSGLDVNVANALVKGSAGNGIQVWSGSVAGMKAGRVNIANYTFVGEAALGIPITHADAHGIEVRGGAGVGVGVLEPLTDVHVTNFHVEGASSSGVFVHNGAGRVHFKGGRSIDNSRAAPGTTYGFQVTNDSLEPDGHPSYVRLTDCVATDTRAVGSKTQARGVAVTGNAVEVTISDGDYRGNAAGAFSSGTEATMFVVGATTRGRRAYLRNASRGTGNVHRLAQVDDGLEDDIAINGGAAAYAAQALLLYGYASSNAAVLAGKPDYGADPAAYQRLVADLSKSTDVELGTEELAAGFTAKGLSLKSAGRLVLATGATKRVELDAAGTYLAPLSGQVLDLGRSSVRFQDAYLSRAARLADNASQPTPSSGVALGSVGGLPVFTDTGGTTHALTPLDRNRAVLVEEFVGGTTTSGAVGELGWTFGNVTDSANAGGALTKGGVAGHPGVAIVDSGTTSGNFFYLALDNAGGWTATETIILDFLVWMATVDAQAIFKLGIAANATPKKIPDTGAWIEKLAADTTWHLMTALAGVGSTPVEVSATPIAATTWQRLRLRIASGTAYASIDGGAEVTLATNMPTGTVGVFVSAGNASAVSRPIRIDRVQVEFPSLSR